MQAGSFSYQDILNKIQKSWQKAHSKNQYDYANDPLYNLVLFLQSSDVPFSSESRKTVNGILTKANSGNVSGVTAEDIVFIVEQINKSIYSSIVESNNQELFWHKRKSVKSSFYQSDFVNNLLFSFISSTSNDNGINNYSSYTVQTAMCVKKLISESENDELFYGQNKDKLINALDLPERDNAAALCRLMYVQNLSSEDALKSIKDILKSVMEYKFKGKNDFISIAYCKYFCAQIDKIGLDNQFAEQTNKIIDSANAFFEKNFVPDLDKIKEFLPEFKMPDRCISPERLRQIALSDVERENSHLANEQRRLKMKVMRQRFEPEDDVSAWKSHYEKLLKFYDAFQKKDTELDNNLSPGQKDYVFLCKKAEIFKAVLEQWCKKEDTSIKRVEYNYDNIQVVNNVTQKIITTLKSNNDNEKNVIFGLIDLFVSDKQAANINQLQIIDKILAGCSIAASTQETLQKYVEKALSEFPKNDNSSGNLESMVQNFKKLSEGGFDVLRFLKDKGFITENSQKKIENLEQNITLTTLTNVKNYFETKAKDLESRYKNGSTEDFDKAVSDFLTTSKNDLKALDYLVKKDIIKKDAYEQYKTKLNDATDLNLIITALYWFINLLGVAISLGQWKARVRAVKSPEKVRIFNRIPKGLGIESNKNEDLHQ